MTERTAIIGYTPLTEEQIAKMNKVKALANQVGELVDDLMLDGTVDTRWIATGRTQLQQGFMAVVRGIAKSESF